MIEPGGTSMIQSLIEPEFNEFVHREIASGKFRSERELVSEALRLLQDRERRRDALIGDLQAGIDQLDRGEGAVVDSPAAQQALITAIVGSDTAGDRDREQ